MNPRLLILRAILCLLFRLPRQPSYDRCRSALGIARLDGGQPELSVQGVSEAMMTDRTCIPIQAPVRSSRSCSFPSSRTFPKGAGRVEAGRSGLVVSLT